MSPTPLQKAQAAYDNRLPPDDPPDHERPRYHYYDTLSVRHIKKARKPHGCDNCGAAIPEGWPYTRWAGLADGVFTDYICCHNCAESLGLLR